MNDQDLKEVFHSLKNNLATMSVMVNLHNIYAGDRSTEAVLESLQDRQKVIALAYERLYNRGSYLSMDFREFAEDIITGIYHHYLNNIPMLDIRKKIDSLEMPLKKAVPLGQILSELLTNAAKHGLMDSIAPAKYLEVEFTASEEGFSLRVKDNGAGFREGFAPEACGTLGMQLVLSLSRQIGAEAAFGKAENGGAEIIVESKQ